jgi:hypothetical protein
MATWQCVPSKWTQVNWRYAFFKGRHGGFSAIREMSGQSGLIRRSGVEP